MDSTLFSLKSFGAARLFLYFCLAYSQSKCARISFQTDMTYKQEKIKPYTEDSAKGAQVEKMFDSIAHSYDLLNHLLSMGIDKRWRKAAIDSLRPYKPRHILDVVTVTGDFP